MRDSELKLESARPGVISNAHPFKSQTVRNLRSFLSVGTKQQSRLKYSPAFALVSWHESEDRAQAGNLQSLIVTLTMSVTGRIVASGLVDSATRPRPRSNTIGPESGSPIIAPLASN